MSYGTTYHTSLCPTSLAHLLPTMQLVQHPPPVLAMPQAHRQPRRRPNGPWSTIQPSGPWVSSYVEGVGGTLDTY